MNNGGGHVKRDRFEPNARMLNIVVAAQLAVASIFPGAVYAHGPPAVAAANAIVGPGIYVSDIQRSLQFYRDLLGMTVSMKYGPADRPDIVIGFGSDPTQAGLMLLSDRAGSMPRKIEHGHGYDRLAIRLGDLAGTHARLRAAGYTVSDIREVHGMFLMAMANDPDGYKVELLGPKPRS
jgi:catechol 2,3-dioxygenase-like lactoylglutathione lyase family enzyme